MQKYGHTHIYTVYIVFNGIFIEVFGHKFYLSMECVTFCDNTRLQKNHNLGKKKHIFYQTFRSNYYTYLAIQSTC